MTLVAVTGPAGGHGITTVAAALVLAWPGPCVLLECDPSGGDVGAWWDLPAAPALASAVAAAPADVAAVFAHGASVGPSTGALVAPLRSVEAAATVTAATQRVLPILAAAPDVEVIVDAGRSAPQLAPAAAQAAVTVVVARQVPGSTRASGAILERTGDLVEVCARRSIPTVVVLIGEDPYPVADVARYFGVEVHAVADDVLGAAVIAGRTPTGRLATRSRLLRSIRPLADVLHRQLVAALVVSS